MRTRVSVVTEQEARRVLLDWYVYHQQPVPAELDQLTPDEVIARAQFAVLMTAWLMTGTALIKQALSCLRA